MDTSIIVGLIEYNVMLWGRYWECEGMEVVDRWLMRMKTERIGWFRGRSKGKGDVREINTCCGGMYMNIGEG